LRSTSQIIKNNEPEEDNSRCSSIRLNSEDSNSSTTSTTSNFSSSSSLNFEFRAPTFLSRTHHYNNNKQDKNLTITDPKTMEFKVNISFIIKFNAYCKFD
jgi:hypothetical protein